MAKKAYINPETCAKCGACISACPITAITQENIGETPSIDRTKCTGCEECVKICPMQSIEMKEEE